MTRHAGVSRGSPRPRGQHGHPRGTHQSSALALSCLGLLLESQFFFNMEGKPGTTLTNPHYFRPFKDTPELRRAGVAGRTCFSAKWY